MSAFARLALGLVLVVASTLAASEKPEIHKPKQPQTREELDYREAQRLYALGSLQERNNRLLEAAKAYEGARRLDPESAAVVRALIPLYLALERTDEALKGCERVLKLDPEDYQTGSLYARQLKGQDKRTEAIAVLKRATQSKRLKERPDAAAQLWFDLGALHQQVSEPKAAIACFSNLAALLENPVAMMEVAHVTREDIITQAAETYERIGRVCLEMKDAEGAIQAFEKAQKKDPARAARLALNLAQVYQGQGKHREGLAQVETFLQTQPQGLEGYELKISLQRKLGREGDILTDLAAASDRDPHNVPLRLLLGREYRKARRVPEAEKVYTGLLEKHLSNDIYRGLFDLHRDQGRAGAEQVLVLFNRAVKGGVGDDKTPGNPEDGAHARTMLAVLKDDSDLVQLLLGAAIRRLGTNEDRGDKALAYATRGYLATLAARTKQLDYAEKLYRSCLSRVDGTPDMEADVYAGLLRVLRLKYSHQAIVEVCRNGLAKANATNRLLFHTEQGRAYQYLNRHSDAIRAFEMAVQETAKPQMLYCKRLLIDALSGAGKHEQALAECQALLKEYNQGSDLREVRATMASVYQGMGKQDLADKQMQLILETDPNDATANNDLGYNWADRNKNLEEAERMIRKALELDKQQNKGAAAEADEDNAAYVDSLGWVLFRRGKLNEAKAELEKASKMPSGDDDPVVWDHLGDVYWRLKDKDRATAAWQKSLSLYDKRTRRMQAERYKEIQEKIRSAK